MKNLMEEYGISILMLVMGAAVLAGLAQALILFLGTMSPVMLSQSGVLMKMVQVWMYGGV